MAENLKRKKGKSPRAQMLGKSKLELTLAVFGGYPEHGDPEVEFYVQKRTSNKILDLKISIF